VLGAQLLYRRSKVHGVIAALLLAFSYPLIVYSSEARGYGLLVFCMVWAISIVDKRFGWTTSQASDATSKPREQQDAALRQSPLLFSTAVILGFLAHPTFIHAYGALAVWTIYHLEERSSSMTNALRELLRWHLAPAIFLLFYYNVFLSRLQISGADVASMVDVIVSTSALALGGPEHGALSQLALVVWLAALVKGLQHVYQRDFGAFLFFLCAIVIMPALMIVGQQILGGGQIRYFPRYFLVSHTAFLLLTTYWLGDVFRGETSKRVLCVVAVVLFCLGNLNHTVTFLRFGRGHYREALQYLVQATPGRSIRVCSNHDFRTTMVFTYYQRYLPLDKELIYLSGDDRAKADWCIIGVATPLRAVPRVVKTQDTRFVLKRYFPFYGLSGSSWWIYGRESPADEEQPSSEPESNPSQTDELAPGVEGK
jgi:hypothetical protein